MMDSSSRQKDDGPTAMDVDVLPSGSLGEKVRQLCGLLKEFGEKADHDELDDVLSSLLEMVGNLTSLDKKAFQPLDMSKLEQDAIYIWNAAVTSTSNAGLFTPKEIATIRHVATGVLSLCYSDADDETVKKKQLMMALKTAKAWLECDFPIMADKPLQLARKCMSILERCLSEVERTGEKSSEFISKVKAEIARGSFKIAVYTGEMAVCQEKATLAAENVRRARELVSQLPEEGPYLAMLCYNFGVKSFQEKRFEHCVQWLKESFDLSKVGGGCGHKNQARTLRLLASAYMEWDSELHWQKALNAVELANAEYSHPAGMYLAIRVLLVSKTQEHRLRTAVEELLRIPELSVDVGLSVVKLLMDNNRKEDATSVLKQLNEKYEKSAQLGSLWVSQLEILLQDGNTSQAKNHVETCIIAHNTGKPMDVKIKKNFHIVLWEQAAEAYERADYAEALQWYNYSLSLYSQLERHTEAAAKLHRNRTACYIGLGDHENAVEAGREAERSDPTCPQTHFILFKVALLRNDKDMALKALKDMSVSAQRSQEDVRRDSVDVHSLICLSAQLALEKNDKEIVVLSLENLLSSSPVRSQALTALRCLIRIKISEISDTNTNRDQTLSEIVQYIKSAVVHLEEAEEGDEDSQSDRCSDRITEATWFMKIAWNMALQCETACTDMKQLFLMCRKLSAVCSDDAESLMRQKTCLLMAAAVSLQLGRDHGEEPAQRSELEECVKYIRLCREVLTKIQQNTITDPDACSGSRDTTTPLLLILYEFEARAKLGDPGLEEVLEQTLALPNTEPKAFETIAALAVEPPSHNKSLGIRALKIAIKKHLQAEKTDFEKCSKAFHSLIELSLGRSSASDVSGKEEAWSYYIDVLDIIENKAKDSYPEIETLWLMTKAWNCGIYFYSTSKFSDAARWCELGMRFLKYLGSTLKGSYDTQMTDVYADILAKLDGSETTK